MIFLLRCVASQPCAGEFPQPHSKPWGLEGHSLTDMFCASYSSQIMKSDGDGDGDDDDDDDDDK